MKHTPNNLLKKLFTKVKYKKSIIDQIFLGFFLIFVLVGLGATVADEIEMRTKYTKAQEISHCVTRALSKTYIRTKNIDLSNQIAQDILKGTPLGREMIENGNIKFMWIDTTNDTVADFVKVEISGLEYKGFWYSLVGAGSFKIDDIIYGEFFKQEPAEISMHFGHSKAGYDNVIGVYRLDKNGCIVDPEVIIIYDSKNKNKQVNLEKVVTGSGWRFFMISDGNKVKYNKKNISLGPIGINNGCHPTNRKLVINGEVLDENKGNTGLFSKHNRDAYFQDTAFNLDGYDHMHIVAKSQHQAYINFITGDFPKYKCTQRGPLGVCWKWEKTNEDDKWASWEYYAEQNGILYEYGEDPKDEYIITFEDQWKGGDKDFNDAILDTTQELVPISIEEGELAMGSEGGEGYTIVEEYIPSL